MNTPPLPDLQAFASVARHSSFRKAALELGVTPSALSHTIKALETRLNLRLLHRTTRSVSPTEAGTQLLTRLAPALQDIAEALESVNALRDSPMGTLRINAPRAAAHWVLPPLVARFVTQHPGMRVEVISDDNFVDIVAKGFDAGVRFGESLQQDMVALPLGPDQRFVVVASPDYIARHGRPRHPRELQQHRCIQVRFPSGAQYRWEFSKRQQHLEVDVAGPIATDDMHMMVHCAEAGVGLAYAYLQHALAGLAAGRLVSVLDDWCPAGPGFFLYHPGRRLMPAGLRAFVDLVQADRATACVSTPTRM